uniref:Uncharacterized protein n=1 Tax=Ditylenchus dipsaci TaxID=166011 RepID=A0A915DN94_9BILA
MFSIAGCSIFLEAFVFRLVLVGTHLRKSSYFLPFLISNAMTLLVFASLAVVSVVLTMFPHLSDSWRFFLEWSDQLKQPVSEEDAYGLTKSLAVWNLFEVVLCIPLQVIVFRAYRVLKYFEKAYLPLYEE